MIKLPSTVKTFPHLVESVHFPHLLDLTEMLFQDQEKLLIQELMLLEKIMSTKVSTSKDHFQQMQTNSLTSCMFAGTGYCLEPLCTEESSC